MNKYLLLAKITLEEYFVYRLNFILWRFRNLVLFITLIFFWQAIYGHQNNLFGYSKEHMLTYVIGIVFLKSLVLGTRTGDLAGQLRSGEMTKIISRPINFFNYWFTRDLTDKVVNLFFSFLEAGAVVHLLKITLSIPADITSLIIFITLLLISTFLFFFISMLISISAFWTEDIWAVRWLFGVIFLEFFSGSMFPIDVLPAWLAKIIYFTPFPYLVYFPMKIWLSQETVIAPLSIVLISSFWLVIFYFLATRLYRVGSKNYGAYGG